MADHIFQPIAMENLGAFSSSSLKFLRELGRRLGTLGSLSGEEQETCFLFQSLSVATQRFNSVLFTMASLMTFRTYSNFSCFYPFCF